MITFKIPSFVAALVLAASGTFAETHEVQMVNKAESGRMAFVPDFLRIEPGDSVKFVAVDKGHNAETVSTMVPVSAAGFVGKINEEIEVTLDEAGVYGVKCKPHYGMGMVMTIAVGDVSEVSEDFFEGRVPKKAVKRFESQLTSLGLE